MRRLGAADMKARLAVMIELARWVAAEQPAHAVDLAFLFFPREELPAVESALPAFLETGHVDQPELVVVLEPTAGIPRPAASVISPPPSSSRAGAGILASLARRQRHRPLFEAVPLVELAPHDVGSRASSSARSCR